MTAGDDMRLLLALRTSEEWAFEFERRRSVADQDVWIFVSYAHDDDLPMSAAEDEVGFVTFLFKTLQLKLRDLGVKRPAIWRDWRRISAGDQFDVEFDDGLRKAEILIVVLSNNWMRRSYCRKELDTFVELRRLAGVENIAERLIVVGKEYVDRRKRPPVLQTQEGFLFYSRDDEYDVTAITPFFNRGKGTEAFYERRDDLALFVQKRVERISTGGVAPAANTPATAGRLEELQETTPATRRWYVSYAWADQDDPNREMKVDELCNDAKKRGVEIIRDKTTLAHGDLISEFMRRIGEGDRVFIFLSDKYLHSPYGVFELFEMWRNSGENKSEFLRRVRFFTIDGTKIGEADEWLTYTAYWQEKREKLRAAINRVGWAWIPERSATRLREADLNVLSKLGNQGLEWRLEPEAFTGGEVRREDDLLDVLVGCPVDIQVARQPST